MIMVFNLFVQPFISDTLMWCVLWIKHTSVTFLHLATDVKLLEMYLSTYYPY